MGSNSASNGDTADFGRTTPTKKEKRKLQVLKWV